MEAVIYDQFGRPVQSNSFEGIPINSNWYHWASLYVDRMYNPDSIPLTEYERIYNTDETVFSGCQIMIHSILSKLSEYEHPTEAIEAFIRQQFEQMYGSIKRAFAEILTGIYYGFSVSEIIFKRLANGQIGLRAIQTLHPQTITIDLIKEGELKNQVRVFWQHYGGAQQVQIAPSKVVHFVHEGNFGNPYGCSRLKRAWKSMFIKDILLRAYGTCLERYGTPITVGTADVTGSVNYKGQEYTGAEFMGMMLDSLGKKGSLIVPKGGLVDIKYAPGGLGNDFLEAIRYCNRSIHQAIGLPSLIADAGSVGSYSLGQEHATTFDSLLESILDDLIDVVLDQLVRPLIEFNFGPQEDYGDFAVESFDPVAAKATAEACKALVEGRIVDPERLADLNHLRERNNLPLLTEEDLSPEYPAMAPSQMLPQESAPVVPPTSLPGRKMARAQRKAARWARPPLPRELLHDLLPTG